MIQLEKIMKAIDNFNLNHAYKVITLSICTLLAGIVVGVLADDIDITLNVFLANAIFIAIWVALQFAIIHNRRFQRDS